MARHILGTETLEGYIQSPVQTLDSLVVNQPHRLLPIAEEAKRLAEQITKDQQMQQWAGIPHEQLLNQSFNEQLTYIQSLETLALLHLTKQHLPDDIIEILERLGKTYHSSNCII